jgi:hypothetical protein
MVVLGRNVHIFVMLTEVYFICALLCLFLPYFFHPRIDVLQMNHLQGFHY